MDEKEADEEQSYTQQQDTEYLKRELGDSLPRALAFVVQVQPPDPITVLALCLRKYRDLNPLQTRSEIQEVAEQQELSAVSTKREDSHYHAKMQTQLGCKLEIAEDDNCDNDCVDEYDWHTGGRGHNLTDRAVHTDITPKLTMIGDIFDDDDTR
ncbi:hypothetical protein BaRGS_00020192 [Batillaria attramentaria]|uniref:Uncharacterized protein n=1 Tax=Batillaria attramentaria TaxID=370345 RepID=A0ABD0KP50_9CAEN